MGHDLGGGSGRSFKATWQQRARRIAGGPTAAYAGVKKALRESWSNDLTQQLSLEATLQGRCGESRDFREGVLAFLEKRAANFEGR